MRGARGEGGNAHVEFLQAPDLQTFACDVLHAATFLNTRQYSVGPFVASPSMGVHTLPWILDYTHLVFWFFFLTSFILGVWLAQTFYLGVRGGEARFPIRETRGQSRAQTGDGITAVIPMSWSITMLMHANTHSSNFDENTSNTAFTCTIIAYQWGWNYYFPRDVVTSVWGNQGSTLEERAQNSFLRQTGAPGAYGSTPPTNTLTSSSMFTQPQGASANEAAEFVLGALLFLNEAGVRPTSASWGVYPRTLTTHRAELQPAPRGVYALPMPDPSEPELIDMACPPAPRPRPLQAQLSEGPARPAAAAAAALPRAELRRNHALALPQFPALPAPADLDAAPCAPRALAPVRESFPPMSARQPLLALPSAESWAHGNAFEVPEEPVIWGNNPLAFEREVDEVPDLGASWVSEIDFRSLSVAGRFSISAETSEVNAGVEESHDDGHGQETLFAVASPLAAPIPQPLDDLDPVTTYAKWAPEVTTTRQSSPWAVDETSYKAPVRRMRVTAGVLLPSDVPIHLICGSKDVIHSWAIPGLGIKIDCIPGYNSHRRLLLRWRGLFWGQCMEVCGRYHHWMPILVRVVHVDVFCMWALATFRLAEGAEGV